MVNPLSNLPTPSLGPGPGGGGPLHGLLQSLTSSLARSMGLGEGGRADAWSQGVRSHVADAVRGQPPPSTGPAIPSHAAPVAIANQAARGAMPGAAPTMPAATPGPAGSGPGGTGSQLATTATTAGRGLGDALPAAALARPASMAAAPPATSPLATPPPLQAAPGAAMAGPARAALAPQLATLAATPVMAGTAPPVATAAAAAGAGTATATTPAALQAAAAQALPVAGAGIAAPLRGEPALPGTLRAEGLLAADRGVLLPPGVAGSPAASASAAPAAPAGTTMAMATPVPPTVAPPSQSPAEVRGNPLLAGGERGAARIDGNIVHGHTVARAGDGRRPGRDRFGALLAAVGAGSEAARRELAEVHKAELAYQWLYWVLTIVAFSSFAVLLIAALPWAEGVAVVGSRVRQPGAIRALIVAGLLSAAGAWALARGGDRRR